MQTTEVLIGTDDFVMIVEVEYETDHDAIPSHTNGDTIIYDRVPTLGTVRLKAVTDVGLLESDAACPTTVEDAFRPGGPVVWVDADAGAKRFGLRRIARSLLEDDCHAEMVRQQVQSDLESVWGGF